MSVILFPEVTGKSSGSVSGDVYLKSPMVRVFSRSVDGTEMGFSAMDSMIAVVF